MSPDDNSAELRALTAQVLAAYIGNHRVAPDELSALAQTIHKALADVGQVGLVKTQRAPAVPIEESITDTHLICLEDGQKFQSLKRHLRVAFGLSPQQYRQKWGLPEDYPMVSPAYARRRSELAKRSGLGKSS
ncbi:MAG: MucR family transcriptional regulator [Pseudomonadota bacterium]